MFSKMLLFYSPVNWGNNETQQKHPLSFTNWNISEVNLVKQFLKMNL